MNDEAAPLPVNDLRMLRAIAHPVRTRILDELGAAGPLRAADIARELGIPANQASFHLRQLAKYGLVQDAPEEARDGRDRVWRTTHEAGFNVSTGTLSELPGGEAAVQVYRQEWGRTAHEAVDRAAAARRDEAVMTMLSETALRLTKEQALEFGAELNRLAEEWRRRGRESRESEDGVRTYQLLQILQPARNA